MEYNTYMDFVRRNIKRIATDAAGYLLILLGIAFGWLPGPGGIPLIVAGLGLLSINNEWAARLRAYLLQRGGEIVKVMFPPNKHIQWFYDLLVVVLLGLVAALAWNYAALWQLSIAVILFFLAVFIAALNRDRYNRIKRKHK